MSEHHLHNVEAGARPVAALGIAAARPFIGPAVAVCLAYIVLSRTASNTLKPFQATDDALDRILVYDTDAQTILLATAFALFLAWCAAGLVRKAALGLPFRDWRIAGGLVAGYVACLFLWGLAHGTHPIGQLAHSWQHPRDSALKGWSCMANVASGVYDLSSCWDYMDAARQDAACLETMKAMTPIPQDRYQCASRAYDLTGLWWPREGYKPGPGERVEAGPPAATRDQMRAALAKLGVATP